MFFPWGIFIFGMFVGAIVMYAALGLANRRER